VDKLLKPHEARLEKEKQEKERKAKAAELKDEAIACVNACIEEVRLALLERDEEGNRIFLEFSGSDISRASSARMRYRRCNNQAGSRCENAVRKMDTQAQALVKRGADVEFMKNVVKAIEYVIEQLSDLTFDIDVGFDDWKIEYTMSSWLKECLEQWKQRRDDTPEARLEREQKLRRDQLKEATNALQGHERKLKKAEKDIDSARQKLNADTANLKRLKERYDSDCAEVSRTYDQKVATLSGQEQQADAQITATENEKAETQRALDGTFFLAFGKKKSLRETIASLDSKAYDLRQEKRRLQDEIRKTESERKSALDALSGEISKLEAAVSEGESNIGALESVIENATKAIELLKDGVSRLKEAMDSDDFPKLWKELKKAVPGGLNVQETAKPKNTAPAEPKKTEQPGILTNEDYKRIIIEILGTRTMTVSEIVDSDARLEKIGNQKVASLVRSMTMDGDLTRTEKNRKAYFSVS